MCREIPEPPKRMKTWSNIVTTRTISQKHTLLMASKSTNPQTRTVTRSENICSTSRPLSHVETNRTTIEKPPTMMHCDKTGSRNGEICHRHKDPFTRLKAGTAHTRTGSRWRHSSYQENTPYPLGSVRTIQVDGNFSINHNSFTISLPLIHSHIHPNLQTTPLPPITK